jgi:hypothetical protein
MRVGDGEGGPNLAEQPRRVQPPMLPNSGRREIAKDQVLTELHSHVTQSL